MLPGVGKVTKGPRGQPSTSVTDTHGPPGWGHSGAKRSESREVEGASSARGVRLAPLGRLL